MRDFVKALIVGVILLVLFMGVLTFAIVNTARFIDKAGGLKEITERVWEGKKD